MIHPHHIRPSGCIDKPKFSLDHMISLFNAAPCDEPLTASERARVLMLLFDNFASELHLDDVLLIILGRLRDLFNVEQVRFYFPINYDSQSKTGDLTLFMVDEETRNEVINWSVGGVAAQVASSGSQHASLHHLMTMDVSKTESNTSDCKSRKHHINHSIDKRTGVTSRDVVAAPIAWDDGRSDDE